MKVFIACLLVLSSLVVYGQQAGSLKATHVEGSGFEGYIFPESYDNTLMHIEDGKQRFTPTIADINKAEKIIKEQLVCLNKQRVNQVDGCPTIHKKLKKYVRQYIGVVNSEGEKVIWVNFIWKDKTENLPQLDQEIGVVLDGCSYYWNLKVNLDSKEAYDLQVNGVA